MTAVDPLILRQASWQAGALVASAGFARDEWQDIRQELILDCLRRSRRFDPTRGEWPGFVRGVMRNHASSLGARKRLHRQREVLSDDLTGPIRDGETVDFFDAIETSDRWRHFDLQIDVRRVLVRLPGQLQQLAAMLGQVPIADICSKLRKSRSRVYQMTVQLRVSFELAGLGSTRESVLKCRAESQ